MLLDIANWYLLFIYYHIHKLSDLQRRQIYCLLHYVIYSNLSIAANKSEGPHIHRKYYFIILFSAVQNKVDKDPCDQEFHGLRCSPNFRSQHSHFNRNPHIQVFCVSAKGFAMDLLQTSSFPSINKIIYTFFYFIFSESLFHFDNILAIFLFY